MVDSSSSALGIFFFYAIENIILCEYIRSFKDRTYFFTTSLDGGFILHVVIRLNFI